MPGQLMAMMKEKGVSSKYLTLIASESFVGNGMVFFIFTTVSMIATGKINSGWEIALRLVRVLGGGFMIGLIGGIIGILWLRKIIRDDILSISITVMCCYFVAWAALFSPIGASIGISVMILGLILNGFGKVNIYKESTVAVNSFWIFLNGAMGNLMFYLIGIIFGMHGIFHLTIDWYDIIRMLALYVLSHLTRFLSIVMFWPFLRRFGYGISIKKIIVMSFSNFRGIWVLIMSITIFFNEDEDIRFRELGMFYGAGFMFFTWLINGMSTK
jgi:NhaP-type Na+/H+ and K+/H+ antiporter